EPTEYTCPMHPEVVQAEPGSCPKCGMYLEAVEKHGPQHDHTEMDHSSMDHGDMGFMSMIDVTKDLPRSVDGLQMDWIDVPFGPFFPGLPGGLLLTFTLDGDTVAGSSANSLVGQEPWLLAPAMETRDFIERLAKLQPLAPICYQVLACTAIEHAAGAKVDDPIARARVIAVEQERIVSHLGWLAMFAQQTGFEWLLSRATKLQSEFLHADLKQIIALRTAVFDMAKRLQRTPLLKSRTRGIGRLEHSTNHGDKQTTLFGPVARASGINSDARSDDKIYNELGFTPTKGTDGDARARLQLRMDEIEQSLTLIEKVALTAHVTENALKVSAVKDIDLVSGAGQATIETARGLARLQLSLDKGRVVTAQLDTPSMFHLALIEQLTAQQELGDALVAVGSLDLSPWEIRP
ncbi:MAG: heavy metal-binding domain-containing protein, partial [Thiohalomonadales bacterium]